MFEFLPITVPGLSTELQMKASAKTYAGVPVQGAKVEYQVTRRNQLWWWGAGSAGQLVDSPAHYAAYRSTPETVADCRPDD